MPPIASLPVAGGILVTNRHVEGFRYLSCPSFCVSFHFFVGGETDGLILAYAIRAGIGTTRMAPIGAMFFREGADTIEAYFSGGSGENHPLRFKMSRVDGARPMNLMKGLAYICIVAGIGVFLNGELIHVGIILVIEGGVLLTLADQARPQAGRSRST